ncbi:Lztr1 [Symbiodinium pilosum]|uniref:Lztr1 protein n=1 Tax=Symbiodinium pilosum TaxID=2952 RepID=A0A812LQ20_SYMPI|nr:Lztr1 [Symbiodinium pilosum]
MWRFGGYSGFTWLNDFHSFNFDTSTWQAVPSGHKGSVPSTRFGYVSAVHGDFMYVFGGYDGSAWLNDMFDFDFERGSWYSTQVQGFIPSGRSCPSWATHNGSVFLFGGYDGVHRMNDFHQFRMGSRTWSSVRSAGQVPSPRYFHASVVYGSSLFLFGGYSGQERLNDLYEFRFDCHTWFVLSTEEPPSGRSSLVAEVFNNSLYVFGGYNGSIVLNDFYEFRFEPVSIPPSNLVDDLRKLINNPAFADVTFIVENQSVYATRAHLAARSEHFRALFYGGMRESSDAEEQIVLQDVAHPVFLLLLEYIYTDQVGEISSELAVHLLIAAERLVLKADGQVFPMQKGLEPGHWIFLSSEIPAGAAYAFVTEWVQELRHCGERSWFGSVHPEAMEVGLFPRDLPSPDMWLTPKRSRAASIAASEKGGYSTGDEATTEEASTPPGEPTDAQRLAASEFFVQATDNPYVTDGCGVRLSLLVAPRVIITGAQAVATDGSWGPLTLRKLREAGAPAVKAETEEAVPEETLEDLLIPGQWIGDAINFCIHSDTEFLLRVHRRDWRVDPNAHGLQREDGDGWSGTLDDSTKMEQTAFAPVGPTYWSVVADLPSAADPFRRCSDRELVLYELHLGSFTSTCEGTLRAAAARLPHLQDLGWAAQTFDRVLQEAVDNLYGTLEDLAHFVQQAHLLNLAVIVDFVFNHMMWGAQFLYGPQLFMSEDTVWGPRPDFSKPEVNRCILAAAETLMLRVGVDGLRVDSTKSVRKLPAGDDDPSGAALLSELTALCRRHGRLVIAEDLEDGDGFLQFASQHLIDCEEHTPFVVELYLGSLCFPLWFSWSEPKQIAFMGSCRCVPAAVHHGKAFMIEGQAGGGDAFQQVESPAAGGSLPYPDHEEVVDLTQPAEVQKCLVLVLTCPGVPMLLQGQEVGDCRPYCWPNGPALDWDRVAETSGIPAAWKRLCKDLISLRPRRSFRLLRIRLRRSCERAILESCVTT